MKKKTLEIFPFFEKLFSMYEIKSISVLPSLRGIQICIFYPCFLTWQDTMVQNVPVIDEISVSLENSESVRNITILFSLFFLLFKPLFVSLSLFTLVTMTTMA